MIATLYISSIPAIILSVVFIAFVYLFKKPINAFYFILFFIFYKSFYIFIGTRFDIWFLISLLFILMFFISWSKNYIENSKNKYETFIIIFVFYVIIISFINLFFLDEETIRQMSGGFFKNEGRIVSQIIFFILTINLIFISSRLIKNHENIKMMILLLLKSFILLSILGIVQYIFVIFLGQENPFPIHGSDGLHHSGYITDLMFRINSIAGEPKHMGIAMSTAIVLIILSKIHKLNLFKYEIFWLTTFLFNLFMTFSTTGYVLTLVGLLVVFILNGLINIKNFLYFILFAFLIFLVLTNLSDNLIFFFEKQFLKASMEVQDDAIFKYLFEENIFHSIIGTGLGNIHYYAVDYLPINFPLFRDTPFKANTGFMYMVSEYGIIGILILYITTILLILKNLYYTRILKIVYPEEIIIIQLTVVFSIVFLFRYYEFFFLLLGVMIAMNKYFIKRIEHESN